MMRRQHDITLQFLPVAQRQSTFDRGLDITR